MSFRIFFSYIYLIPMLLSAIFSLKAFSQKWPKPFKIFSVYLIASLIVEIFAIAWYKGWFKPYFPQFDITNLWIYNFGLIVAQSILMFFFYFQIKNLLIRKSLFLILVALIPFALLNYFVGQGPYDVNTRSLSIFQVLILLCVTILFLQVMLEENTDRLLTKPLAWILIGLFIYNLFAINFILPISYIQSHYPALATALFSANDTMNLITYTFFLIAFLCKPRPKLPSTPLPYPVSS